MSVVYLSNAVRKARKEHACYWCLEPIRVGDEFHESVCADEGRIDTWRAHSACAEAERRAYSYIGDYRLDDEGACCLIDYRGGYHGRGKNCPECSDMPVEGNCQ